MIYNFWNWVKIKKIQVDLFFSSRSLPHIEISDTRQRQCCYHHVYVPWYILFFIAFKVTATVCNTGTTACVNDKRFWKVKKNVWTGTIFKLFRDIITTVTATGYILKPSRNRTVSTTHIWKQALDRRTKQQIVRERKRETKNCVVSVTLIFVFESKT